MLFEEKRTDTDPGIESPQWLSGNASETSRLSESDRAKLLVKWNETNRDYPRDQCAHQLFEQQVERTPDAIAHEYEGSSLTYAELNERANRAAAFLRQRGIGTDSLVCVCMERSFELVIALLGVWKAGAAYVPLDPSNPLERLQYMVRDSRARVVMTSARHRHLFSGTDQGVVCTDWEVAEDRCVVTDRSELSPSNLAYVMYTSGSTGTPKGVMVTHAGLVNYLCWAAVEYSAAIGESIPIHSSIAFDLTVTALWVPLIAGGRVELLSDDVAGQSLLTALRRKRGRSLLKITPAHLILLTEQLQSDELAGLANTLVIGGENLSAESLQRWRDEAPSTRLINEYGPTETVVGCSIYEVDKEDPRHGSVPIGRPIANTQLYVLDHQMNPVPPGIEGELYIGGAGVARGYWNRPDLTRERFVQNRFSADPDSRLYKSGDRARYRRDGVLEYLGRSDNQVKIRGFRIELGEIEAKLAEHPAVKACAVLVREESAENKQLVGFVTLHHQHNNIAEELIDSLQKILPPYMIPSRLVLLDQLPLTPNGKVDRTELLNTALLSTGSDGNFVAPSNPLESSLCAIWSEVLGRDQISCADNFFSLGAHSLLAMRFAAKVFGQHGQTIPVRWIFEYPTIQRLSRKMHEGPDNDQDTSAISPANRQENLPASFGQKAMWLVHSMLSDSATYNQPMVIRVSGEIDSSRIRRCIGEITARHEILRTGLEIRDDKLVQLVRDPVDYQIEWKELTLANESPSDIAHLLKTRLLEEVRLPFDLAQAPLWRVLWIDINKHEAVLAFTFHHSIIDEWSLRQFLSELSSLYRADGRPEQTNLSALPIQYADYATWQNYRLTGDFHQSLLDYWKDQLSDLPPPLELTQGRMRPRYLTDHGAIHEFRVNRSVATAIRQLAREEGTTLFTVLLACFQVCLYRQTGQPDIIIGSPIAERDRPELQSLIGYFLNAVPIRSRLESDVGFRQFLRQVHAKVSGALSHASLPFQKMVEIAAKDRDVGKHPIFQIMFVLLEEPLGDLDLGAATGKQAYLHTGTSKYDLTLDIQAEKDEWVCRLEYATDLFDPEFAVRMSEHFIEILNSITKDSRAPIGNLNIMNEAERRQILVEWNRTQRDYPRDTCMHRLFEAQVERTPEVVAATFARISITYRELNIRANRLAHHLQALGVGPEVCVGVCLERSLEMIVALLAVLKAGGAYVPLDPNYPDERLQLIAEDSQIQVLITDRDIFSRHHSLAPNIPVVFDDDDHAGFDGTNLQLTCSPSQLAYLIYTSGSTGLPKGVAIEHRNAVSFLYWIRESFTDEELSGVLAATSICFDLSIFELFGPLCWGGRVILVKQALDLEACENRDEVTLLNTVPSVVSALLKSQSLPQSIITVNLAGEPLSRSLVDTLFALNHVRNVNDLYGPSETTTYSTWARRQPNQSATIGRPIANTQVYVLDDQLQPVPLENVGNLWIGGAGVARGYWRRSDLTAERFLPNPFVDDHSSRMYRTGDLARWRPDGQLEYLGRADHQVKIRGYRVELGEIEMVLCSHPDITESAVVTRSMSKDRDDNPDNRSLVAFLRVKDGAQTPLGLRSWLSQKLPKYMIPAQFVVVQTLPLTPNGKLDRKKLMSDSISEIGGVEIRERESFVGPF
jgi:amino acid adenylation domain-containing protein